MALRSNITFIGEKEYLNSKLDLFTDALNIAFTEPFDALPCVVKIENDNDYARLNNLMAFVVGNEIFGYEFVDLNPNYNKPTFENGTYCTVSLAKDSNKYTICRKTVGEITLDNADPILVEGSARMLLNMIETVDRLQNLVEKNEDFQSLREFVDIPWENDDECSLTVNKDLRNLLTNKINDLIEYITNA